MVRVVMIGQMSCDEWNEKNMKENDQDEVDGTKQEANSKDSWMHIKMSGV